ncbi:hypothetical protein N2W50_000299 [Clostridium perfringens]|nr:hypothetical protein [Clostridium perfringens]ELC8416100.1 hypothetical protein [Clostridium perfringens]
MKIKDKVLNFIEEKGIAKKILNYLERTGTVEISLVGLRIIVGLLIGSIILNFYLIDKSGGFKYYTTVLLNFIGNFIKDAMYMLKDFDKNSPGTLSFVGAVLGGVLGFYGATIVFKKQMKLNKKQSMDKLMHLLLHTYRVLSLVLDLESSDKKSEKDICKSKIYKALVYDESWRSYISEIEDFNDKEIILRWFFNIENNILPNKKNIKRYLLGIEKILKKYGYRKQLYLVKKEIESSKKEKNKNENSEVEYSS